MLILSFEIWVYVFYNGLAYEVFLLALCRPQALDIKRFLICINIKVGTQVTSYSNIGFESPLDGPTGNCIHG